MQGQNEIIDNIGYLLTQHIEPKKKQLTLGQPFPRLEFEQSEVGFGFDGAACES